MGGVEGSMRRIAPRLAVVAVVGALVAGALVPVGAGAQSGGEPLGNLERLTLDNGRARVKGWAINPGDPGPVTVHVWRVGDGRPLGETTTRSPRPDVAASFPSAGSDSGFEATVGERLPEGENTVCAFAMDAAGGNNPMLGCLTIFVAPTRPIGVLDTVSVGIDGIRVSGWTVDGDASRRMQVHVWRLGDTRPLAILEAGRSRPDVAAAYPGFPTRSGFRATLEHTLPEGAHTICAYGINQGEPADNALLGCEPIVVRASPFGALDTVTVSDKRVTASGWAIDPNTAEPIPVHLWRLGDTQALNGVVADESRPDVAAAFPGYGDDHGFTATSTRDLPDGSHTICAYAINFGPGSPNTELGCRQVMVGRPPNVIYLTFDDGPWPGGTDRILDILASTGAKATFFAIGRQVTQYPDLSRRIVREGHSLQNHTHNHRDLTAIGDALVRSELRQASDAIVAVTGARPSCVRPVGGFTNVRVERIAAEQGLDVVMWNVDPEDWTKPGATAISSRVLSDARDGAVVVLHDGGGDRSQTVAALPGIIASLQARGFTLAAMCQ